MAGISNPFAGLGPAAKAKLVILGPLDSLSEDLVSRVRSLNLEHVSPLSLKRPEISRRPTSVAVEEANRLSLMRRWFFARKPDAGFLLTDFPATLLQAKVFDEWLETRDESLQAVFVTAQTEPSVRQHYVTLGLAETGLLAAS